MLALYICSTLAGMGVFLIGVAAGVWFYKTMILRMVNQLEEHENKKMSIDIIMGEIIESEDQEVQDAFKAFMKGKKE